MVLFLNYKLVMFASAISLVIILTSNTVLVTSSSETESHHFVQHPQGRRLLSSSKDGYNYRKNLYGGKMPPGMEKDDSIKTGNGLKSENGSDDNKEYESSYKRAGSVTNTHPFNTYTPSVVVLPINTPGIGGTGSTNTPIGRTGFTTTRKSLNNKDNLSHVQPLSKQQIRKLRNKLLTKAGKKIIDQNKACPVLGYSPKLIRNTIDQYYFERDDQNSYVHCIDLENSNPFSSLESSKNYESPINIQDLKIVNAYELLPNNKYASIREIYVPSTL